MSDTTISAVKGIAPRIAPTAFVAPGCRIIGDVSLGENASVWYNCVIRGDMSHIRIGARTNVQDSCMIHCDDANSNHPIYPTLIGEDCMVGHMSMLHGCTLEDRAVAGMGTIIFNGATIESDGMLAAGAMLTSGKVIRSGELWSGRPAKFLRNLTAKEIASNQEATAFYIENCRRHADAKSAVRAV
ncbi:carbonic anhydrase [Sphingomonas sp. Root710]|uniref:gamma carbonic anhydrase family protein n=1 Tax=Sphingomonas sp. Root710 TaxID=1736594 RepID=UPI0006FA138C|nr:gamma carbonic anhydrase family protein [Sphingomonas sp. Root710]KRB85522.1 carbonic anhydrase [Sphingomonas sp. Root710]